jgi:hypothetical protein
MRHPRRSFLACAGALALWAGAVLAQPWAGPLGLGIEVKDRGGRPVADASLVLAFLGTPGNGPRAATDAAGRAEIVGLAEGAWVVSVRHPDYLGYDAQLLLAAGRRPSEEKSFQVKVSDSVERLRVRFYQVAGPSPATAAAARGPSRDPAAPRAEVDANRAERQAAREQREAEREARREAERADRERSQFETEAARQREREEREERERRREAASTRAPRVEAPEADEQPATAGGAPAEPRDAPQPARTESAAPRSSASTAPPAPRTASSTAPAVASPTVPAPDRPSPPAAPAPSAPTAAAAAPHLRASRDGSCIECRPNEWAVTAAGEPRPGGPPECPEALRPLLATVARSLGERSAAPELQRAAAPLLAATGVTEVAGDLSGAVAEYAAGGCQVLAVKLPRGAGFQGFQLEVEGAAGALPCIPDQDCPGGAGRWATLPVVEESPAGKVIGAAFRHAGAAIARPRLTVYFLPPAGWSP